MATKSASAPTKKEASTNNYVAIAIVVTIVVVIVCGIIAKSEISSLIKNTKVISGDMKAKRDLDTKLENIPQLIDHYNNLGTKKDMIAHGLPNKADLPQIVSMMQGISASSSVQLRSISPTTIGAPVAGTPVSGAASSAVGAKTYDYTVDITGSYTGIVSFFRNIEKSVRPIKVVNATFSGDSGTLAASVQLETYFQDKADISDKTQEVK